MKHTHAKLIWLTALLLFLAIPATLLVWGLCLPAQYEETFLGELKYKCQRLEETQSPRIVIVGGSAAAFGVDGALLEQELSGYTAVNFGMYAGLGTQAMLELSRNSIRAGDLVILMPEQEAQSLSGYFNGDYMWQALDGAFPLAARLDRAHWGQLAGCFPAFAARKLHYFFTGAPAPQGVYARASFDGQGDLRSSLCAANVMPGGFDPNTPIRFSREVLSDGFVASVNDWAEELTSRGAVVWYHFPPMNELAIAEDADLDGYFDYLQSQLSCRVIGDPHNSAMDPGWFYDTNFHLNASGQTVFTRQLVRDIKAVLGDSSPTRIALPALPAWASAQAAPGEWDDSDGALFLYEEQENGMRVVGLTDAGKERETLTVPAMWEGKPVTVLAATAFAGDRAVRQIALPGTIALIEDGAFSGCASLESIQLQHTDPASCRVGQGLLDGTDAAVLVPAQAVQDYYVNYFWSVYAGRIQACGDK